MSPQRDDLIDVSYPLHWPIGRPRTKPHERQSARFRGDGGRRQVTISEARDRAFYELELLRAVNIVISSNLSSLARREPEDPGCAVYFQLVLDRDTTQPSLSDQHVLACDRWDRLPDNIAAVAAHAEALRGQLRWGVAIDASQAFAGFKSLPAVKPWWRVLGFEKKPSKMEAVKTRFRKLALEQHPDRGGSVNHFTEITAAVSEAAKDKEVQP